MSRFRQLALNIFFKKTYIIHHMVKKCHESLQLLQRLVPTIVSSSSSLSYNSLHTLTCLQSSKRSFTYTTLYNSIYCCCPYNKKMNDRRGSVIQRMFPIFPSCTHRLLNTATIPPSRNKMYSYHFVNQIDYYYYYYDTIHQYHNKQQRRYMMAFITGHTKSNQGTKNKKLKMARNIKRDQEIQQKKKMKILSNSNTDETYKKQYQTMLNSKLREKKSKMNMKNMKKKSSKNTNNNNNNKKKFDPSKTLNYPYGPNGLNDEITNDDGTITIITPEERLKMNSTSIQDQDDRMSFIKESLHNNNNNNNNNVHNDGTVNTTKKISMPPLVMVPTGSIYVYIAKIAYEQLLVEQQQQQHTYDENDYENRNDHQEHEQQQQLLLFEPTMELYKRHHPKLRTSYTFVPYGPMFVKTSYATSNNTSIHPNRQSDIITLNDDNNSNIPEVAFIGRSNVGKSSLINALMNQNLAITSKQPGRTQQAYYYGWITTSALSSHTPNNNQKHSTTTKTTYKASSIPISALTGFLVDLPGYGYAVGPDKAVETWQLETQNYIRTRRDAGTLKRIYVLQDSRLQSPQSIDGEVLRWLEEECIPHTIVLTKADDHSTAGVIKHVNICCLRYYQLWSEIGGPLSMTNDVNDNDNLVHEEGIDNDDYKDDEDEESERSSIMLSPMVHVTSAKKQIGLTELLTSIETEFTDDDNYEYDDNDLDTMEKM